MELLSIHQYVLWDQTRKLHWCSGWFKKKKIIKVIMSFSFCILSPTNTWRSFLLSFSPPPKSKSGFHLLLVLCVGALMGLQSWPLCFTKKTHTKTPDLTRSLPHRSSRKSTCKRKRQIIKAHKADKKLCATLSTSDTHQTHQIRPKSTKLQFSLNTVLKAKWRNWQNCPKSKTKCIILKAPSSKTISFKRNNNNNNKITDKNYRT